ncbi:MAG TPA: YraN family protein [Solirubrobacteraceae bacterium]|nr:YraN family protein [Solirubrobacteraceae bacterium]
MPKHEKTVPDPAQTLTPRPTSIRPGWPPAKNRRQAIGQLGERLAAEHLERRGMKIVARNQRTRYGEIDLIARDGGTLIFVEVKTRSARSTNPQIPVPLEGWSYKQRRRLRRLAAAWLAARPEAARGGSSTRFDAVGVVLDGRCRLIRLEHLENV